MHILVYFKIFWELGLAVFYNKRNAERKNMNRYINVCVCIYKDKKK